jgi:3',5'-cyclic AMP phosphodiesterase CpdA
MLIAQITDLHIGFGDPADPEEMNQQRLQTVLARLVEGPNRPDLLIASGDLTDSGKSDSSERVAELLRACPFPVHAMVGNHDTREALLAAFRGTPSEQGFIHYALELGDLRLLLLDTTEPGRHSGAFCTRRQAWLADQLDSHPDTPTLIFMHHPPVESGIAWMDPALDAQWIRRFGECVEGRRQLLAIHCGHLHRQLSTGFRGIPLGVTPPVAPLVALDFNPLDPDRPDQRTLITGELPAYALHRWNGSTLVTHYQQAGEWQDIAAFDERWPAFLHKLAAEQESG